MKVKNLIGERFKERPADCVTDSHAFMVRGGYIKNVSNGVYSLYTPANRIKRKIENIIREEMENIGAQEVLLPEVSTGSCDNADKPLSENADCSVSPVTPGLTKEGTAVHLVREYGQSYAKYPFVIYQFKTEFCDKARPGAGLLGAHQFTSNNAYSFHASQQELEEHYEKCREAYDRIFSRCGIPEAVTVESYIRAEEECISHKYMLLTPAGEASVAVCGECGYRADMDSAESVTANAIGIPIGDLEEIYTPDLSTIEDIINFVKVPAENTCKAVVYQKNRDDKYIIAFLRGDLEVNEYKLTKAVGEGIRPALITEESGISPGFIGPIGLPPNTEVIFDRSLRETEYLVAGANKADMHIKGLNIRRDYGEAVFCDIAKIIDGGICPRCGKKAISVCRGIELGRISQAGTSFTKALEMQYTDVNGESRYPVMGCYGIGIEKLAASACEVCHDEYGPVWPAAIAPWEVQLCCIRADDEETGTYGEALYRRLLREGIEVLYDDRNIRAGAMFADADLLGVPIRIIVSPRNIKENLFEINSRDKKISLKVGEEKIIDEVKRIIKAIPIN
ncbi:prolyl-tRNA synthetase [Ruminiclostridium sufflavum DSM 19573]|uniref:Proline--tRNA ligase n=1 Tax=Ruminiclostridium sufflavum DSM 19573 TaxID=1121337 RepID=A0A318XRC4_9FIRM|nr:proline--tRNA ligase [Ruminiclostridium sufflavum]PYG90199.1 prolyl-tRNA synthetase [Ruminiclostridium sufflavum DSM 19573]